MRRAAFSFAGGAPKVPADQREPCDQILSRRFQALIYGGEVALAISPSAPGCSW